MNITNNTSQFTTAIYIGDDVELNTDECFFVASLFWNEKSLVLISAQKEPLSNHEKRKLAVINKICRIIHDGDTRHPGAWPEAPVTGFATSRVLPNITIAGVTLPETYVDYFFNQMRHASDALIDKAMRTRPQYDALIKLIENAVA